MLDVRRLEVLAVAVRERSLAAAARTLGITPSAASQAVAALEAQSGVRLLTRQARGVVPTPAGERLALHAEAVLAQLSRAEAELARGEVGTLRVAAFATAVAGLLAPAVEALRSTAPRLRLDVLECEPDDARAALDGGRVDVALVNHDATLAPDSARPWAVHHLLDEPVLAALPAGHPQAQRQRVDLRRLAGDPWVMQAPASPCQQLTVRACGQAGFAPAVTATCADYRSILALVGAGLGVSLVPRLAARGVDTEGVVLRPTRAPVTRRVTALVPASRFGAWVVALLDALRGAAAGPPPRDL